MIVLPSEVYLSAGKENLYDLLKNRYYLSTFHHDNDHKSLRTGTSENRVQNQISKVEEEMLGKLRMLQGTRSKGTNISKVEPCTEAQVLDCSWCNICLWSNLAAKSKWDQDAKAGRL